MIKSVQKATVILSTLSDNYEKPVSLAVLSSKTGINKSTCSHILNTLEQAGFVIKISRSKGHILGPAAYCLTRFGGYKSELVDICRPVMQYLYQHTGYTIVLAIMEKGTKYILHSIDKNEIYDTKTHIRADDIYRTATGRAILLNTPSNEAADIFKKYGNPSAKDWPEVQDFEEYKRYKKTVSKKSIFKSSGCFYSDKLLNIGYGAPLFSPSRCVGAIGVAIRIPVEEEACFIQNEEKKILCLLKQSSAEINRRLSV